MPERLVHEPLGRVLIVEDDVLIGMTVEDTVRQLGCERVLVAHQRRDAIKAISLFAPNLAIVDISLGRAPDDFVIADALAENQVPFIFYSGTLSMDVPERHRKRPFVSKPAHDDALTDAISLALAS